MTNKFYRTQSPKGIFESGVDRPGQGMDFWLIAAAATLLLIGLAAIHSIDVARPGASYMVKQVLFAAIGMIVFLTCSLSTPKSLERLAPLLYGLNIVSLMSIFILGTRRKGATRWIDFGPIQFQPSEVAKVILIITLAVYFSRRWSDTKSLSTYLGSLFHVAPVIALVLLQPHFAGSMSLVMIWLSMSLIAGINWKYVAITAAIIGGTVGLSMKLRIMPPYMLSRIEAALHPDPKGNAYQQERAKIAFGVGGATGVGYLKGEQKAGRYIPEQQNDFIFTVIGEEFGMIGAGIVVAVFGFFFYRIWLVGFRASDPVGQLLSGGVLAVLGFHTIVNLGMNVGILPVAGLWLPFMSYGGTALWMCMACVGLMASVR